MTPACTAAAVGRAPETDARARCFARWFGVTGAPSATALGKLVDRFACMAVLAARDSVGADLLLVFSSAPDMVMLMRRPHWTMLVNR